MEKKPNPKTNSIRSNGIPVNLPDLKATLISAGEIVRRWWDRPQTTPFEKKDQSPLTLADKETNTFLQHRLSELLPRAGWLSEESEDDKKRLHQNWVWVVDPLDGTNEFIRRIPEISISIGLILGQTVIIGGVYNPITGEGGIGHFDGHSEFWGFPYNPTPRPFLGGVIASVSRREIDDGSILPYLSFFRETRVIGSVAYKLLRVAAGLEDLTLSVQPKWEWDICGGVGLIQATGKFYFRLDGNPVRFNQPNTRIFCGAVAGPESLSREMAQKIFEKTT